MNVERFLDLIEKKDWFIYQSGLLLSLLLFCASFIAANYTLVSPIFPEYLREGLYWAHIKRGCVLSLIAVTGTVVIDSICVFLVKKGILDDDSFMRY